MVSDDADELYGESIDEDSQSVKLPSDTAPAPSTSGMQAKTKLSNCRCAMAAGVLDEVI